MDVVGDLASLPLSQRTEFLALRTSAQATWLPLDRSAHPRSERAKIRCKEGVKAGSGIGPLPQV